MMTITQLPNPQSYTEEQVAEDRDKLHNDGWVGLRHGMFDWELRHFVEKLHNRYHQRIVNLLTRWKSHWMEEDTQDSAPGSGRPGALVARWVSEKLEGSGVFVYAAHPSQHDDAEDDYDYAGPRWYITCSEAAMRHYANRGIAPPPPPHIQDILWPHLEDRRKPWLTEIGWTLVPDNSPPQVMHADICSSSEANARKHGRGRYHHFLWKLCPTDKCTTNVVSGGFSEGCASWDDYDRWSQVSGNAIIFDSEMLHRGAAIPAGKGWTSTLTIQLCAGTGWKALNDRVGANLMWYTQAIGWEEGAAVDVLVDGRWLPALVVNRSDEGQYTVLLDCEQQRKLSGLEGDRLRFRRATDKDAATLAKGIKGFSKDPFPVGLVVEAEFEGKWHEAKVVRCNEDGTYRVVWKVGHSFTDALPQSSLRICPKAGKKRTPSASFSPVSHSSDSTPEISRVRQRQEEGTEEESSKRRREGSLESQVSNTTERLLNRGWVEMRDGLPEDWRNWDVIAFVESCYDTFNDIVMQELESLRHHWEPCQGSGQRWGAFAASKVTERLKDYGVAVYSPGDCQQQEWPFSFTGPRWYVSVTQRALWQWGGSTGSSKSVSPSKAQGESKPPAPAPPTSFLEVLHGHSADRGQLLRARGLGWTLAPPGSNPQAVHADIWGFGKHARTDRTRWPHLLWKRCRDKLCTTEVVPGGFTEGGMKDEDFRKLRVAAAPAILVDSEVLHRGAKTREGQWASTLSIEFCTASGWRAWEDYQTGGTTKDPTSPLDWRMLLISGSFEEAASERRSPAFVQPPKREEVNLPPAPWLNNKRSISDEQKKWETSGAC